MLDEATSRLRTRTTLAARTVRALCGKRGVFMKLSTAAVSLNAPPSIAKDIAIAKDMAPAVGVADFAPVQIAVRTSRFIDISIPAPGAGSVTSRR